MEKLINVTSASRLSGKARNTIKAWIASGKLPSIQQGGVNYIRLVDFMNIFPTVTADQIDAELNGEVKRSTPSVLPAQRVSEASLPQGQVNDQSAIIDALKRQIEAKDALIKSLNDQIDWLKKTAENMWNTINQQSDVVSQLTGRLLPLKSSSPASSQPRDKGGRFATKKPGDGVGALFQQASLVPDDSQD